MSSPASPERFHALDATRAFALMLGVVFHAIWSFVPVSSGGAIIDSSPNGFFYWFFFTSHSFRMQLFFLIAGFFAHLLYHRRGAGAFIRNRLLRIAVPLAIGWLILSPLVMACWTYGGNVSGKNLPPVPIARLLELQFQHGLLFQPSSVGGMFNLVHLWFLYYLLWCYALVLALRFVVTRAEPLAAALRRGGDAVSAWLIRSPWAIVGLAIASGFFLWPMRRWSGVDTPIHTLIPSVPVLLLYGGYFSFGWLLHRQAHCLAVTVRNWRWQLALGLIVSVPLFLGYRAVEKRGAFGSLFGQYPMIEATNITNWPAFLARLKSSGEPGAPAELASLWEHLPASFRTYLGTLSDHADPNRISGVATSLTALLVQPGLFSPGPLAAAPTSAAARAETLLKNRAVLDRHFAGSLADNPATWPWYSSAKLIFAVGYGLVMWLILFGTLGLFQALCNGHSPAWRYVADSSYWIYLVHLPLVALLQIRMAPWALPGVLKFPLLLAIAFSILFASYHYLVRSTFIGRLLNGQSHPFVAWPLRRSAAPVPNGLQTASAESRVS